MAKVDIPGMIPTEHPLLAAALLHYRRVILELCDLDGYDAVFDRETGILYVDPAAADMDQAIHEVLGPLRPELTGEVDRAFAVIDGALARTRALAPPLRHTPQPRALRSV